MSITWEFLASVRSFNGNPITIYGPQIWLIAAVAAAQIELSPRWCPVLTSHNPSFRSTGKKIPQLNDWSKHNSSIIPEIHVHVVYEYYRPLWQIDKQYSICNYIDSTFANIGQNSPHQIMNCRRFAKSILHSEFENVLPFRQSKGSGCIILDKLLCRNGFVALGHTKTGTTIANRPPMKLLPCTDFQETNSSYLLLLYLYHSHCPPGLSVREPYLSASV